MSESVNIALDAMGGDNAPHIVIAGANIARRRYPNVRFLLFGDREEIEPRVAKQRGLAEFVEIHHTPERVTADDKPSQVLRSGRSTSMWLAIDSVKHGNSSGVVSAGNTGAMMAMAMFQWRNLPGIDRPAIASFFPTLRGETVMLDLGANISCDARNLVQFAIMGEVYSRTILGIEDPTLGLLNVGEEETKEVMEVMQSKYLFRYGDLNDPNFTHKVYSLEQAFAKYCGVPHALATSSGTCSLLVSLQALGIKPGDEVIVPAYTFVATYTTTIAAGAVPVLCEVD